MDNSKNKDTNYLDSYRHAQGDDGLSQHFRELVASDRQKAAQLLGTEDLQYSSLYILRSEIEKSNLTEDIPQQYRDALDITRGILEKDTARLRSSSSRSGPAIHESLKWMLETGWREDGLEEDYDEVLEITAAMLVRTYSDHSVLPVMLDMMFERHRKGTFMYDLAWAFFESGNPQCIVMIASRLNTGHPKDIALVHKLLHFIPGIQSGAQEIPSQQYAHILQWYHENSPFLHYTGESFQQTCKPIPFAVSTPAKYLGKRVSPATGLPLQPLAREEQVLWDRFVTLDPVSRNLLSSFSCKLYRRDITQWNDWMYLPLHEQIRTARVMGGGAV